MGLWRHVDGRGYWELNDGGAIITIRPHAGDAGRWEAKQFGVATREPDGFPRYYMDLMTAQMDLGEWLAWMRRIQDNLRRLEAPSDGHAH